MLVVESSHKLGNLNTKLKKEDFNRIFRFRGSRKGLVNCVTCDNMSGEEHRDKKAFCKHKKRVRRVKLARYLFADWNNASTSVCDAYASKPLPEGVVVPVLPEKQALLLGSQFRDIYHADPLCPYVIAELRMERTGENDRAKVCMADISDRVPMEVVGYQICEMPCCSSKLNFQTWRPDSYRQSVGIKPDGTERQIFVRKVVAHENKITMTPAEAEAVFDLSRFASEEFEGKLWDAVSAAHHHLTRSCNRLGSKPISEATNPVQFSSYHEIWERPHKTPPHLNPNENVEFWAYDSRLFDHRTGPKVPIRSLEKVPEGIIPCIDTKGVLSCYEITRNPELSSGFEVYGIIKPVEESLRLPRGVSHFIEVWAISYNNLHNWWSGVFGKGFYGQVRSEQ